MAPRSDISIVGVRRGLHCPHIHTVKNTRLNPTGLRPTCVLTPPSDSPSSRVFHFIFLGA